MSEAPSTEASALRGNPYMEKHSVLFPPPVILALLSVLIKGGLSSPCTFAWHRRVGDHLDTWQISLSLEILLLLRVPSFSLLLWKVTKIAWLLSFCLTGYIFYEVWQERWNMHYIRNTPVYLELRGAHISPLRNIWQGPHNCSIKLNDHRLHLRT